MNTTAFAILLVGIFANILREGECLKDLWTGKDCLSGEELCANHCFDPKVKVCKVNAPCFPEEEICYQTCYDPKKKLCTKQEHLCDFGEDSCGGTCFDPKAKSCPKGGYVLCELGQSVCGVDCYDPANMSKVCMGNESNVLCDAGQSVCGGSCYTAWHGSCIRNSFGGLTVCTHGYLLCRLRGAVVGI